MVEVRVLGIALDAVGHHIVLLKPVHEAAGVGRVLPISIGEQEATSILIAISGEQPPRPLSHDLMKLLLETVEVAVERVEVTRIEEGTFFAEISLLSSTGPYVVDSRPSDAIALAVRAPAPIFVADDVLEESGIPAELAEQPEDDEVRLDEFKRFLDKVEPEDFEG